MWAVRLIKAMPLAPQATKPFVAIINEILYLIKELKSQGKIKENEWDKIYTLLNALRNFCVSAELNSN